MKNKEKKISVIFTADTMAVIRGLGQRQSKSKGSGRGCDVIRVMINDRRNRGKRLHLIVTSENVN